MKLAWATRSLVAPAVRPRAGAWIETKKLRIQLAAGSFAPARGRGLKLLSWGQSLGATSVRPRAGAWIETLSRTGRPSSMSFAPARGRGLKQDARRRSAKDI